MSSPTGAQDRHAWIPLLGQAISEVLVSQNHSNAFAALGFEVGMPRLRPQVAQYLPPFAALPIRPLDDDEISQVLGRRRTDVSASLFNGPRRAAEALASMEQSLPPPAVVSIEEAQLPRGYPLRGQVRSRYVGLMLLLCVLCFLAGSRTCATPTVRVYSRLCIPVGSSS